MNIEIKDNGVSVNKQSQIIRYVEQKNKAVKVPHLHGLIRKIRNKMTDGFACKILGIKPSQFRSAINEYKKAQSLINKITLIENVEKKISGDDCSCRRTDIAGFDIKNKDAETEIGSWLYEQAATLHAKKINQDVSDSQDKISDLRKRIVSNVIIEEWSAIKKQIIEFDKLVEKHQQMVVEY